MITRLGSIINRSPVARFLPALLLILTGCTFNNPDRLSGTLNSRYNDEQPALSGDGRWIAFISDRRGPNQILLYDLRERHYVELPGLYVGGEITDSPSLSRTGRYLVYRVAIDGRPVIALYDRLARRSELLTNNYRGTLRNPSIGPDGRYIVFESARDGQWNIEILDRGASIELDIADGTLIESPPNP